MARYDPPSGTSQSEAEPGSRGRVLKNLLGIKTVREMDRAEYRAFILFRDKSLREFEAVEDSPRLNASLLRRWHHDWLGGLYEWAGKYRVVDVMKDNFRWPPARFVAQAMESFEGEVLARHTPCPTEPIEQTARRMAEVHGEFLFIHPFREGNGRLARWVTSVMAMQAGHPLPKYPLDGKDEAKKKRRYIAAVGRSYVRDYGPLTDFFDEALRARLT